VKNKISHFIFSQTAQFIELILKRGYTAGEKAKTKKPQQINKKSKQEGPYSSHLKIAIIND